MDVESEISLKTSQNVSTSHQQNGTKTSTVVGPFQNLLICII